MTDATRESVDRWEVTHNANGLGFSDGIRQSPHGNFVALSDYATLLTRAEAAEAERDALQAKLALAVDGLTVIGNDAAGWGRGRPSPLASSLINCAKATLSQITQVADTPKDGKDDE